jgi:PAS domain-containing protein
MLKGFTDVVTKLRESAIRQDVSTHDLLAVAVFSHDLQYLYGNRQFTRVTGLSPHALAGASWNAIFPGTDIRGEALLGALRRAEASVVTIELPQPRPRGRRASDHDTATRTRPSPGRPATVYRITNGASNLIGVIAPPAEPVTDRVVELDRVRVTSAGDAVRRMEQALRPRAGSDEATRTALLSVDLGTDLQQARTQDHSSRAAAGAKDPLVLLASRLVSSFRSDDVLSVLHDRWVLMACPNVQQSTAAHLHERLRVIHRRWRESVAPRIGPPAETRMVLGDHLDWPADLFQRLRLTRSRPVAGALERPSTLSPA